ncbi:MAG: protein phosphatase 2C domain-containing protein [Clostridiales bacterium]|jgi:serine/threonine protein phosphatase PrpC|nr:protein phosphatase 2C domain-containing protein [Clostridiales bacterium]
MRLAYGSSIVGVSHIKKKKPCQDALAVNCTQYALIAAVCDGLGSQKHSGMASKVASEACVKYCSSKIKAGMSEYQVLSVICEAFEESCEAIEDMAREKDLDIWQCDTTMTLGVLIGADLYYGQVGDSGMIALFSDGSIRPVTRQQNDKEGRVYPLKLRSSWDYNKVHGKVASALLCTDGIWRMLNAGSPEQAISRIKRYLDPGIVSRISKSNDESVSSSLCRWTKSELERINNKEAKSANFDDLTMVVMHDTSIPVKTENGVKQEPGRQPNPELVVVKQEENHKASEPSPIDRGSVPVDKGEAPERDESHKASKPSPISSGAGSVDNGETPRPDQGARGVDHKASKPIQDGNSARQEAFNPGQAAIGAGDETIRSSATIANAPVNPAQTGSKSPWPDIESVLRGASELVKDAASKVIGALNRK